MSHFSDVKVRGLSFEWAGLEQRDLGLSQNQFTSFAEDIELSYTAIPNKSLNPVGEFDKTWETKIYMMVVLKLFNLLQWKP